MLSIVALLFLLTPASPQLPSRGVHRSLPTFLPVSGDSGFDHCSGDDSPPLPAIVDVAILYILNTTGGRLAGNPLHAAPTPRTTYAWPQMAAWRGSEMYEQKMAEEGPMPLRNGGNVTFRYTHINLGFIDTTQPAEKILPLVATEVMPRIDILTNGTYHAELGGPYTFIIAPVFWEAGLAVYLMSKCELSGACIVINPFDATRELSFCRRDATGNLPLDCQARGLVEGARRFNHALFVMPDSAYVNDPVLSQFRTLGIHSIGMVGEASVGESTFIEDNLHFTAVQASQLGMSVVYQKRMVQCDYCPDPTDHHIFPNNQSALDVARELKALNPDALLFAIGPISAAYATFNELINAMKQVDWMPKMLSWAGGGETFLMHQLTNPDILHYTWTLAHFDSRLRGPTFRPVRTSSNFELFPATTTEDAPQVFAREFNARYGQYYPATNGGFPFQSGGSNYFSFVTYQSLTIVQKLLEYAMSIDMGALQFAATRVSVPSLFLQLEFDVNGRERRRDLIVLQYAPKEKPVTPTDLDLRLIFPYNVAVSPIYPLPTWQERVFDPVYASTSNEQIMLAFTLFCLLLCVIVFIVLLVQCHHPVIRAATPSFCALVLVGVSMMLTSNFFATLVVDDTHCAAQVWLLTLGFTLCFGALFIKTFRVYKLLTNQLKPNHMSEQELLVRAAVVLAMDGVINGIWMGLDGMGSRMVIVDPIRPAYNYRTCDYTDAQGFIIAHLVVKCALLLVGAVLAWSVRSAPSAFNESSHIALSIYNVSIVCCFVLPVLAEELGGRQTTYMVRAFAIMFVALSTILLLFTPKMYRMWLAMKEKQKQPHRKKHDAAPALPHHLRTDLISVIQTSPHAGTQAAEVISRVISALAKSHAHKESRVSASDAQPHDPQPSMPLGSAQPEPMSKDANDGPLQQLYSALGSLLQPPPRESQRTPPAVMTGQVSVELASLGSNSSRGSSVQQSSGARSRSPIALSGLDGSVTVGTRVGHPIFEPQPRSSLPIDDDEDYQTGLNMSSSLPSLPPPDKLPKSGGSRATHYHVQSYPYSVTAASAGSHASSTSPSSSSSHARSSPISPMAMTGSIPSPSSHGSSGSGNLSGQLTSNLSIPGQGTPIATVLEAGPSPVTFHEDESGEE